MSTMHQDVAKFGTRTTFTRTVVAINTSPGHATRRLNRLKHGKHVVRRGMTIGPLSYIGATYLRGRLVHSLSTLATTNPYVPMIRRTIFSHTRQASVNAFKTFKGFTILWGQAGVTTVLLLVGALRKQRGHQVILLRQGHARRTHFLNRRHGFINDGPIQLALYRRTNHRATRD